MPSEFFLDSAGKFIRIFRWNLSSFPVNFVVIFFEILPEFHRNLAKIPLIFLSNSTVIPPISPLVSTAGCPEFCRNTADVSLGSTGNQILLFQGNLSSDGIPPGNLSIFQRNLSGTSVESGWIFWWNSNGIQLASLLL